MAKMFRTPFNGVIFETGRKTTRKKQVLSLHIKMAELLNINITYVHTLVMIMNNCRSFLLMKHSTFRRLNRKLWGGFKTQEDATYVMPVPLLLLMFR